MKIAITGHKGKIGSYFVKRYGLPFLDCDIRNKLNIRTELDKIKPDIILHFAAMTDVDKCEKNGKEAFEINVRGTLNLLELFTGSYFIYMSTDHVFDGQRWWFNCPREHHDPKPINNYGFTKWQGEVTGAMFSVSNFKIIRSSKIFSYASLSKTIDNLLCSKPQVFPNFIRRSFMHIKHFADSVMYYIDNINEMPNLLHIAGTQSISYSLFWVNIAKELGISGELIIERNKELPDMSPRPFRGGLNVDKAMSLGLPNYSFANGIEELKKEYLDENCGNGA